MNDEDRDYLIEMIEGRFIGEHAEDLGERPTLELAYVFGRFDGFAAHSDRVRARVPRPFRRWPFDRIYLQQRGKSRLDSWSI